MRVAGYMLYRAVASGDLEEVAAILAATPEAAKYENDAGENCLHAACEYHVENYTEHHRAIAPLVAAGCDINKLSTEGRTPLMTACYYGHATCVECLLKLGADASLKARLAMKRESLGSLYAVESPVVLYLATGSRLSPCMHACRRAQDKRDETALDYSTLKMGATIGHTKCRTLISSH